MLSCVQGYEASPCLEGGAILVPFFCDVFVGETFAWGGDRDLFMGELETRLRSLADEGHFQPWE